MSDGKFIFFVVATIFCWCVVICAAEPAKAFAAFFAALGTAIVTAEIVRNPY